MRIGFIEDTHLHGGTQIWVTEATRAFLARGEEVTLLAPEGSWVVEQVADTTAHIATYDWNEVVHESAADQETWANALAECDVAVCTVHPPRHGFHCSVFAGRCIKEAGLDTHLIPKTGTIVPEYLREFYRPDETIHSSVIAIAGFTRQYLIETYKIPAEAVALIYQGVDVQRFTSTEEGKAEARRRYPIPEGSAPILGCIGSFEHRKGQPVLFEAVAKLASGALPDVFLMLLGDGPDEAILRGLAKEMGLKDRIAFFSFTSEPEYGFERIDITVLSSLYKEGLPNVLQESMCMGVPVVSSNMAGVPEIVIEGETGYMAEPGNSNQLAQGIRKLWVDQAAYKQMRKNVRTLMERDFDKETQFDRFLEHFGNCVSGHS